MSMVPPRNYFQHLKASLKSLLDLLFLSLDEGENPFHEDDRKPVKDMLRDLRYGGLDVEGRPLVTYVSSKLDDIGQVKFPHVIYHGPFTLHKAE